MFFDAEHARPLLFRRPFRKRGYPRREYGVCSILAVKLLNSCSICIDRATGNLSAALNEREQIASPDFNIADFSYLQMQVSGKVYIHTLRVVLAL